MDIFGIGLIWYIGFILGLFALTHLTQRRLESRHIEQTEAQGFWTLMRIAFYNLFAWWAILPISLILMSEPASHR